jgi:UDP-N-acetylmuramate--alanine ligase
MSQQKPLDWFVYTSALREDHPELLLAKRLGLKVAKRDELIARIIEDKNLKLIAIAGTHGKTTTTSIMVWTLQQLGIPVSYSIGTTIPFGPSGKFDPKSEYFVYECDEFDRNFLHFHPFLSLIAAIDYDHSETYPTSDEYLKAFQEFASQSKHVIAWRDQYGEMFDDMSNVEVIESDKINSDIKLFGDKNRCNATLVQLGLQHLGITEVTDEIISHFRVLI